MRYEPPWLLPHANQLRAAVRAKDRDAAMRAIAAMTNEVEKLFKE